MKNDEPAELAMKIETWTVEFVYYVENRQVFGQCGHKHTSLYRANKCLAKYKNMERSLAGDPVAVGNPDNVWIKLI